MGIGIRLTCKQCSWSQEFTLGVGMMYGDISIVIQCLPRRYQWKVVEIVKEQTVDEQDFEHAMFVCEKCGALKGRFWMRLRYDGNKIFETEYDCHKCRQRMTRVADDEIEKQRCPECGQAELKSEATVLWD